MRKILLVIGLILFLARSVFAGALPFGLEASGDVSLYSQYVWRGFLLDRDTVIQPGFYISTAKTKFGKFKAGIWSSQDLQNKDNLRSKEYDYIFDYTYELDNFSFSLGHTYYDFADTNTFSREFYVGLSFPKLFLTPSVYFYRDYGNPQNGGGLGNYTVINAAHSFELLKIKERQLTLDLSGHVGFNHNQFIDGDGGDVGLKVGFTIPVAGSVSFTPNVNYSIPFGDLSDPSIGNQKNRFYGGFTLTYAF
jgi:hypothetical protein